MDENAGMISQEIHEEARRLQEYLEQVPSEDYERKLEEILSRVQTLSQSNPEECAGLVTTLATGVGRQRSWQVPYRECGILGHAIDAINPSEGAATLSNQYLRLVGNCVADNNQNRIIVLERLDKLIACLLPCKGRSIATTVAVIFNLCNDYEPAQTEAARLRLDKQVAQYLADLSIPEESADYAIDLLNLVIERLTPAQLKDEKSFETVQNLLLAASKGYDDNHIDLLGSCASYLLDMEVHQKAMTPKMVEQLAELIFEFEGSLESEEIDTVFKALETQVQMEQINTDDFNSSLMVQLINTLSSISASDAFIEHFDLQHPLIRRFRTLLLSSAVSPMTVCACVVLGNLTTTDEVSIEVVEDRELTSKLVNTLSSCQQPAILYAAAGCVRHLAFPEQNRTILGHSGLIQTCCDLLDEEEPSIRGEAAAILCKLVTSNEDNITAVTSGSMPLLTRIVDQSLAPSRPLPSTSMKNATIELARTIIAILRYIRQMVSKDDANAIAKGVLETHLVARPVAMLVRQRFYANARSEGLLGLGLMAQSADGAACVAEEMKADEGLLYAIEELAREQQSRRGQNAVDLGRDHQNAIVLLHGLAMNGGSAIDAELIQKVEAVRLALSNIEA